MRGVQGFGNIQRNPQGLVDVHRIAVEELEEGVALEVLHYDERTATVLANLVNRADVGVIQSRSSACLAAKAIQCGGVAGEIVGQKLQCNETAKVEVLSFVNHSHAPTANQFNDAVVRYDRVDHCGDMDSSPRLRC